MRVALLSDSPTLPTGWARNARPLIAALSDLGHEVWCFGVGVTGTIIEDPLYPCRIWASIQPEAQYEESFAQFMASERPDAVLINYDLIETIRWLKRMKKVAPHVPIVSHLVVDGLPVYPFFLRDLNQCAAIIAVTLCVREHVAATVARPVYYFPHMVDCEKFQPLPGADRIKRALFGDSLVIGAVAQNRGRKQLVQTIHAIRLLRDAGRNPVFLLRTDRVFAMPHGGSPLRKVAEYFGVQDIVHISESEKRLHAVADEVAGTSRRFGSSLELDRIGELTVGEHLNLCDVAVIASAFGGFEYGIIEAQSCGIPVCVTDDGAIMMEVAGGACEPIKPSLHEFTPYGAKIWKVAPASIAAAITTIIDTPNRRETLHVTGIENAKRYDRAKNQATVAAVLGQILVSLPKRVGR